MISRFYTTAFTVRRLTYTGRKGTYSSITGFSGHIQQASQLQQVNGKNQLTITHSVWCDPATDIRVGDSIASGGRTYSVHAIQNNGHGGANPHLELLVERDDIVSA